MSNFIRNLVTIFQISGGIILALIPFFLEKVIDVPSRFGYFWETNEFYNLIAIIFLLLFSPQILYFSYSIYRTLLALCFFTIYRLKRKNYLPIIAFTFSLFIVAIGMGSLFQGGLAFGYSMYKTFVNEKKLNRQYLITKANALESKDGFGGSTPILNEILLTFPDDFRNDKIEIRLATLENARKTATTFEELGVRFLDKKQYVAAENSFLTALHIWPSSGFAKEKIGVLKSSLHNNSSNLKLLHKACLNEDESAILTSRNSAGHFLKNPGIIDILVNKSEKKHLRKQVIRRICEKPLIEPDFDTFFSDIKDANWSKYEKNK